MSRGLHRQQHHQESPLSQHCRNNRSQATGPGLKRGRTTGSGDCQHLFKDKAASGDQQKEHDVLWAQQPPARIKGTKPAVGAPQETPGGAGERRSRDKAHGVTAACHPHQGALGAGTKPARSQKKGSRSHPGHSKLPLCSQAATSPAPAAGNPGVPQPGQLNDGQRTRQAAFHVLSCVLGTEDEGILYPENTQLF